MKKVAPDDVVRHIAGEVTDAREIERIEKAIAQNPEYTALYNELLRPLEPSAAGFAAIKAVFDDLDRAVWAHLRCEPQRDSTVLTKTTDSKTSTATISPSPDERISLVMEESWNTLRFQSKWESTSWQPSCLVLYCPVAVPRDSISFGLPRVRSLAAHTRHSRPYSPWRSPPAVSGNLPGVEAWLEQTAVGVKLYLQRKIGQDPPGCARYRMTWREPTGDGLARRTQTGTFVLSSDAGGMASGEVKLGHGVRQLFEMKDLEFSVNMCHVGEFDFLNSRQFRAMVGEHQVLPLQPVSGIVAPPSVVEAKYRNDRQRQMWLSSSANKMLCLQPA